MTMAATTTQRPPALPGNTVGKAPNGAAKMARTYLDHKGLPQKSVTPVPVDQDDRRTLHELFQCPHLSPVNGGGKERCPDKEWLLPDEARRYCPQHGKQLEQAQRGPSKLVQTITAARKMHGDSAKPWLIPGGVFAAETVMAAYNIGAVEALAAAPVLAAGTFLVARRTLTKRAIARKSLEKGEKSGRRYRRLMSDVRRSAWYGGEVGLWAAALAGTDIMHLPGVAVAALGMARWAFASRDWWKSADDRRDRGAADVTVNVDDAVQEQTVKPDPVRLRAITTWVTAIGCAGGPLAGTELVDFTPLPAVEVHTQSRTMLPNWKAKVVAKDGVNLNMREARPRLRGLIASAYKCTYADVSFYADESDYSVGWVRVQPDNPLAQIRMWTGPGATDWSKGVSRIGRFDDGVPIDYQWADEGGACHDLLGGCSGSGKSELVAQLLLTSLHSGGLVLDWVGDPQRGQSFGRLKDMVDWFARDKAEIKLMLLAAVKEMYRRNDVLSNHDIKTWTFAVAKKLAMPLLVITLDEVQNYIDDPDILELVTILAGMARKCGIKLRLITQIIAAYNLGGDTYIKEQTKTGQTMVFRAETDVAGRSSVEGDSLIDPTELPKKWGPYTCAAGKKTAGLVFVQGVHGRDVYGRTDFTGEDMAVWLIDPSGDPSVTPGVFSPEAQRESGVLWGDRKERARRLIEAGRDDADILPNGKALELIEAAAVVQASQQPLRAPEAGQPAMQDRARDKVFAAALKLSDDNGVVLKPDLWAEVKGEMASGTMDKALTDLIGDGVLLRPKNGLYVVAGKAKGRQQTIDEVPV